MYVCIYGYLQKRLTATVTKDLISSINNAMLDDIEINRSKTIGDSSLPVSLTMKGVAPGSSAVVVTDDGTVQLPDMKTPSSAVAQVFLHNMLLNCYSGQTLHFVNNWKSVCIKLGIREAVSLSQQGNAVACTQIAA